MTPSQLYVAISILSANQNRFANRHEAGKIALEITDLIQQAESEWLFEFIGWYADEFEMKFTDAFKSGLVKRFLNAPKP